VLIGNPQYRSGRDVIASEPEIAQAWVIIGAAAKRPVILAIAFLDWEVVYARNALAH
jgi:hypothetical protein